MITIQIGLFGKRYKKNDISALVFLLISNCNEFIINWEGSMNNPLYKIKINDRFCKY
jgi:hypothetical protein